MLLSCTFSKICCLITSAVNSWTGPSSQKAALTASSGTLPARSIWRSRLMLCLLLRVLGFQGRWDGGHRSKTIAGSKLNLKCVKLVIKHSTSYCGLCF